LVDRQGEEALFAELNRKKEIKGQLIEIRFFIHDEYIT